MSQGGEESVLRGIRAVWPGMRTPRSSPSPPAESSLEGGHEHTFVGGKEDCSPLPKRRSSLVSCPGSIPNLCTHPLVYVRAQQL